MEPFEEESLGNSQNPETRVAPSRLLMAVLVALLGIAGIAASYGVHERGEVKRVKEQADAANSSVSQLQTQVNTLTARLNDMSVAQATAARPTIPSSSEESASNAAPPVIDTPVVATAPSPAIAPTSKPAPPKSASARRKPVVDKRYAQLKAQLDDQQKQLKETQDEVAKNRADLEGSISSTKDELNGAIAKTHDELVLLEKRGERSYFEFDLTKSKDFQRVGPMPLSLRRTDTKHKNYDLMMLVDDNELSKKKVNLYEPIWIHTESGSLPVQVVVNRIGKNAVHGYVSAPKYKPSELSASAPNTAAPRSEPQPTQQSPQH